jgi:peptidoglycan/LPS O-acetylase OafA/YrhL
MSRPPTTLQPAARSIVQPGSSAALQVSAQRYPEIDAVKGLALLGVLLIHAQTLDGTALYEHLVNRSVPVLLVLFGAASELWWSRRSAEPFVRSAWAFVRGRYARLMPPVWVALAAWWLVGWLFVPQRLLAWPWLIAHGLAYVPQVGTGWFITLIVQLVLLFPLLHWAVARLGWIPVLSASLALSVFCHVHAFEIIDVMRTLLLDSAHVRGFFVFYYEWIFAPLSFLPVVAGIVLARRCMAWPRSWSIGALVVWVLGSIARDQLPVEPLLKNALLAALDIPCTMLLLDLTRSVARVPGVERLRWIGQASWGMYLGQLVVHTTAPVFGFRSDAMPLEARWLYFAALCCGAVLWVLAGRRLREHAGRLLAPRAPGAPPHRVPERQP